ncbi:MAG: hypothetical protein II689_00270, partial [Firmicutes bacterium]|nr:hypothetical protein [Bacillota bacterium]
MKSGKGSHVARRLIPLLLCLAMVLSTLPAAVFAADEDTPIGARVNTAPSDPIFSYYTLEENQIQFLDMPSTHDPEPAGPPTVTVTDSGSVFLPDTVTITGAVMHVPVGNMTRYFTVLTAGDIYSAIANDTTIHKWANIVIDTTAAADEWIRKDGMDVYLVGFGKTVEGYNGPHPTKGIQNISVTGDYVNVYLVDCNIGAVKNNSGEGYTFPNPSAFDNANCTIRINGMDSHIYMDSATNADVAGRVGCRVQIYGTLTADYCYNPDNGSVVYDSNHTVTAGATGEFLSTAELSNLRICQLGSSDANFNTVGYPNGVLEDFSGVTLYNCEWGPGLDYYDSSVSVPLDRIVLNDFSSLSLIGTSPVSYYGEYEYENRYATIELNHLSSLTLSGEIRNLTVAKGRNTLTLKDAALRGKTGKILVDGECNANTQDYISQSELYYVQNHRDKGARLDLLLGGDNTIMTDYDPNGTSPDIMVDNVATLLIKDDPDEPGVGSLTIGSEWGDGGHGYCAAIGGTASMDPLPHGAIYVKSGVLTAYASTGSAAIGGSITPPYVQYVVAEGGEGYHPTWDGDPSKLFKVYQNTGIGYLYFDPTDDQFNPSKGGYWLLKEDETTYVPVVRNGNSYTLAWVDTVYEVDEHGDPVVDEENSTPGFSPDAGEFNVTGGLVNATALSGGAAIGGASGGNGGWFAITRGTVNATASGGGAAIGGGEVDWGSPVRIGIGFRTQHDWLNSNPTTWTDGIYVDGYTYSPSMGGGSGHIYIYGGVINAVADNPAYDQYGNPVRQVTYYNADGSRYDGYDVDGEGNKVWHDYYTFTDQEYIRSLGDGYYTGKQPGYVIGSTCENANGYYENTTEILNIGGIDANPVLILSQKKGTTYGGDVGVAWGNFYRAQDPSGVMTWDALGRDPDPTDLYDNPLFSPALITEACMILGFGWEDTRVIDGETGQVLSGSAEYTSRPLIMAENHPRTYRVRGQINIPDLDYHEYSGGVHSLVIPEGTVIDMLPGSGMNVPEHFAIMAADMSQFVVEEGAAVQGKGRWPGKPPAQETAPTTEQVRSL